MKKLTFFLTIIGLSFLSANTTDISKNSPWRKAANEKNGYERLSELERVYPIIKGKSLKNELTKNQQLHYTLTHIEVSLNK